MMYMYLILVKESLSSLIYFFMLNIIYYRWEHIIKLIIFNFCELKTLAYNGKIKSSAKYLIIHNVISLN